MTRGSSEAGRFGSLAHLRAPFVPRGSPPRALGMRGEVAPGGEDHRALSARSDCKSTSQLGRPEKVCNPPSNSLRIFSLRETADIMSEKANDIIEQALTALRAEAADIQNKISALEGALSKNSGGTRRAPAAAAAPKKATNGRRKKTAKKAPAAKDATKSAKIKEAANKRAASWTPEKKKAAAERMRKYWAERKKQKSS